MPARSASLRAFTPVFDGLWTRVNAFCRASGVNHFLAPCLSQRVSQSEPAVPVNNSGKAGHRAWLTPDARQNAFTRVHSPSKTGVNALNDALCAGMSGKKNSPGRGDYCFFFFPARRFFGGGLYTVASISRANRAARPLD